MPAPALPPLRKVTIYTDGGCEGNPGPGGWAAVLRCGEQVREISGGVPATTNNRMELQAAIEALATLQESCEVEFFTDSEYVRQGISAWIFGWKTRSWLTRDKKPVKNGDLWRALDEARSRHRITWKWLKGHAGQADNERCDELAGAVMQKLRRDFTKEQLRQALAEFRRQNAETPAAAGLLL